MVGEGEGREVFGGPEHTSWVLMRVEEHTDPSGDQKGGVQEGGLRCPPSDGRVEETRCSRGVAVPSQDARTCGEDAERAPLAAPPQVVSYPLALIRTRLQAQSMGAPARYEVGSRLHQSSCPTSWLNPISHGPHIPACSLDYARVLRRWALWTAELCQDLALGPCAGTS